MNFLSTGVKELTRRLRRQQNRLALANARRFVDKAEVALGRHGWRAVADDPSVAPAQETLRRLDGTVAGLAARIAELDAAIAEQEAAREQVRREHQATLDRLEAERRPLQETPAALQSRIAGNAKALQEQNAKRVALQGAQTSLLKEERRARRPRALPEEERARRQGEFDARRAALAEQAAQLAAARSALVEPITADRQGIKLTRLQLRDLEARVQQAAAALAEREHAITLAIAERTRDIAAARRQVARVEAEKDGAYLAIGRRLTELSALPGGEEFFASSRKFRQNYERLAQLETALQQESGNANRQDLRIFNFVGVTLAVMLAIVLLLVFRTPGKRDWLPSNTQAILTVNVRGFTNADFTRALESQVPEAWEHIWTGLVQTVARVPQIDVRRQVARITHALAPAPDGHGLPVDYLLVELRPSVDVDDLVRHRLCGAGGFGGTPRYVGGLPIYLNRENLAIAQIGPDTVALGSPESVETLIQVRLGLKGDLKSDAQFFSEFQRLSDDNSAFRLVTHRPRELTYLTDPLINAQILGDCQALGLTLDMHEPVSAVFLLNATSPGAAAGIARLLQANPDQVLQLQSAGPNLFIERPTVSTLRDTQVEWRFRMTAPAAREFLQRVSRLGLAALPGPAVAEK